MKVDAATLPGGGEDLGDGGLDALMGVRNDELDAAQPRRASLRRKAVQKVSASDGPISMPQHLSAPSALTPTATMTGTDTMRPAWRIFR